MQPLPLRLLSLKDTAAQLDELGVQVANNGGSNAIAVAEHAIALLLSYYRRMPEAIEHGIPTPLAPLFSRPLFARFAPSFRRSFAVSGFLAPRRRERAKNGVKWAKFGGETAEKQRWLSGVGHRP